MTGWGRRGVAVLAAVLGMALLAGCGGAGGGPEAAGETRMITTDRGQIDIPVTPQRIVVLSGGLAGYLYALDAPVVAADTRVLGVTGFQGGFPPSWADAAIRQGTTALPAGEQLSLEAVAAAKPDLIIGGGQGITAVQAGQAYDRLAAIAPTVLIPRTVVAWQDQLRQVADVSGRADRVPALLDRYQQKVQQVRAAIAPPPGSTVYVLSAASEKIYIIPPAAATPALGREVGIQPDDVLSKIKDPRMVSTGDSFEVSPELLPQVANAPNAIVVSTGGRTSAELARDPVWAQLPAFKAGRVADLPATSYRPDFDGALSTLDALAKAYPSSGR